MGDERQRRIQNTDYALLANAAMSTTAQRAYIAKSLLPSDFELLSTDERIHLVLEALAQFVTSTEDILAWVCALMQWDPLGSSYNSSLVALLDRIQIGGRGSYSEDRLEALFSQLDVSQFRSRLRLPDDSDLVKKELPESIRVPTDPYLKMWLDGVRRVISLRQRNRRTIVRAFNKYKHGFLAIYDQDPDGHPAAWILSGASTLNDRDPEDPVLNRTFVRALPHDIRIRFNWAVQMQAVLQGITAFMLGVHFDEWIETPDWVSQAHELEGWLEE